MTVRSVSDSVRLWSLIFSANLRRKLPLIARRTGYDCAPLQLEGVGITTVHPRACGEHVRRDADPQNRTGSSPRLRGTLPHRPRRGEFSRFIPAPAGNTSQPRQTEVRGSVHPRACGEHPMCCPRTCTAGGSSPRLRGTPLLLHRGVRRRRFIPAPAGNTQAAQHVVAYETVHPRACGEHSVASVQTNGWVGSSPRLRGTPVQDADHGLDGRFIPAPAGNTAYRIVFGEDAPVHPRACGEHQEAEPSKSRWGGSSPRLRGPRRARMACSLSRRFIPAPAGNTLPRPRVPARWIGSWPVRLSGTEK